MRKWLGIRGLRRQSIAVVGVFTLVGSALVSHAQSAAASAPSPPQNVTSSVVGTTVTISWQPPANDGGSPINLYELTATDTSTGGTAWGSEFANGTSTSVAWPNLIFSHSYSFAVVARNGTLELSSPATTTATVGAPPCGSGTECVTADATSPGNTEALKSQGVLGWQTYISGNTSLSKVTSLDIQNWRNPNCCMPYVPNSSDWSFADSNVQSITFSSIQSYWQYDPNNQDKVGNVWVYGYSPWDNVNNTGAWTHFDQWIPTLLTDLENENQLPGVNNGVPIASPTGYFDILNECDQYQTNSYTKGCYYHSNLHGQAPTLGLVEQEMQHAYNDIRSWYAQKNFGTPHFVTPSTSNFDTTSTSGYGNLSMPLDQLLSWSNSVGITWDAISWHEFPALDDFIPNDVQQIRADLSNYPNMSSTKIFINENDANSTEFNAGFEANRFWALETGGVDQANRACWTDPDHSTESECYDGSLDGLLTKDGSGNETVARSVWYVDCEYAQMNGGQQLPTSTSDNTIRSLAVEQNSDTTVRMFVGRYTGTSTSPATVDLQVTVPSALSSGNVIIERIQDSESGAGTPPSTVQSYVGQASGGVMSLQIPTFADGDAYLITISTGSLTDGCASQ